MAAEYDFSSEKYMHVRLGLYGVIAACSFLAMVLSGAQWCYSGTCSEPGGAMVAFGLFSLGYSTTMLAFYIRGAMGMEGSLRKFIVWIVEIIFCSVFILALQSINVAQFQIARFMRGFVGGLYNGPNFSAASPVFGLLAVLAYIALLVFVILAKDFYMTVSDAQDAPRADPADTLESNNQPKNKGDVEAPIIEDLQAAPRNDAPHADSLPF